MSKSSSVLLAYCTYSFVRTKRMQQARFMETKSGVVHLNIAMWFIIFSHLRAPCLLFRHLAFIHVLPLPLYLLVFTRIPSKVSYYACFASQPSDFFPAFSLFHLSFSCMLVFFVCSIQCCLYFKLKFSLTNIGFTQFCSLGSL